MTIPDGRYWCKLLDKRIWLDALTPTTFRCARLVVYHT